MIDKQAANRIVLAAVILGGSIIVAATVSTGGPWRVVIGGGEGGFSAVRFNTWTGATWSSFRASTEWGELREKETAQQISDALKRLLKARKEESQP